MGFLDNIKKDQKQYGAGPSGDYFKFEDKGVYRMRILHEPKVVATHFFGKGNPSVVCVGIDKGCTHHGEGEKKPSIKLATYIIDRADGKIKMAELPLSVSYSMNDLQDDEDFTFKEFPMPYDVKITYDPDNNDPKAIYRLTPSPQKDPLTIAERKDLVEKLAKETPEQYVEAKKARVTGSKITSSGNNLGTIQYPREDIDLDDIPFD